MLIEKYQSMDRTSKFVGYEVREFKTEEEVKKGTQRDGKFFLARNPLEVKVTVEFEERRLGQEEYDSCDMREGPCKNPTYRE